MVKVKASHTRYRAMGSELIPVYSSQPAVTVSHPPDGRLRLLSARPAVTSPATEHHPSLAGTKLYCLVTEAHRCEQLAHGCYAALHRVRFEPRPVDSKSNAIIIITTTIIIIIIRKIMTRACTVRVEREGMATLRHRGIQVPST